MEKKTVMSQAKKDMNEIDPRLNIIYSHIIWYISEYPESASKGRGKNSPEPLSSEYIKENAHKFYQARLPKEPKPPATIPDEVVSIILDEYFNVPNKSLEKAKKEHLLSMGAEGLVGDLLERYLSSIMEAHGWLWCAGAMIRGVDFIKPPGNENHSWTLLQVKNRDNSENSSSSAIREGTEIKKWFRTFSRRAESNWDNFPDDKIKHLLSEKGFIIFVRSYLKKIK